MNRYEHYNSLLERAKSEQGEGVADAGKVKAQAYVDYELWLGTFEGEQFKWKVVEKYKDFYAAYRGYKAYVNKQLKYTDEELRQVWTSGRLDIELRQGSKLLNWVGIFCREVDKDNDDDDDDEEKKSSGGNKNSPHQNSQASKKENSDEKEDSFDASADKINRMVI